MSFSVSDAYPKRGTGNSAVFNCGLDPILNHLSRSLVFWRSHLFHRAFLFQCSFMIFFCFFFTTTSQTRKTGCLSVCIKDFVVRLWRERPARFDLVAFDTVQDVIIECFFTIAMYASTACRNVTKKRHLGFIVLTRCQCGGINRV